MFIPQILFFFSEKTRILYVPSNQVVRANTDVILFCNATTDPAELNNLDLTWLKDGQRLGEDPRLSVTKDTTWLRLRITRAKVDDTGSYSCVAANGIDEDSASVDLVVQGTEIQQWSPRQI